MHTLLNLPCEPSTNKPLLIASNPPKTNTFFTHLSKPKLCNITFNSNPVQPSSRSPGLLLSRHRPNAAQQHHPNALLPTPTGPP